MLTPDYLPEPGDAWTREIENVPFMQHVGPIWQRLVDGRYEYCFRIEPCHGNLYDYMHGGMTATFADHALGYAALRANGDRPIVTAHLDVNFISGARVGELLFCRPEVVRKSRSLCFMRGDIMAGERIVATASGVWKAIDP